MAASGDGGRRPLCDRASEEIASLLGLSRGDSSVLVHGALETLGIDADGTNCGGGVSRSGIGPETDVEAVVEVAVSAHFARLTSGFGGRSKRPVSSSSSSSSVSFRSATPAAISARGRGGEDRPGPARGVGDSAPPGGKGSALGDYYSTKRQKNLGSFFQTSRPLKAQKTVSSMFPRKDKKRSLSEPIEVIEIDQEGEDESKEKSGASKLSDENRNGKKVLSVTIHPPDRKGRGVEKIETVECQHKANQPKERRMIKTIDSGKAIKSHSSKALDTKHPRENDVNRVNDEVDLALNQHGPGDCGSMSKEVVLVPCDKTEHDLEQRTAGGGGGGKNQDSVKLTSSSRDTSGQGERKVRSHSAPNSTSSGMESEVDIDGQLGGGSGIIKRSKEQKNEPTVLKAHDVEFISSDFHALHLATCYLESGRNSPPFFHLAKVLSSVCSTTKRLEKERVLTNMLLSFLYYDRMRCNAVSKCFGTVEESDKTKVSQERSASLHQ